ncbi:hypothetical protein C5167_026550 [Papaver somniferum]|nr:hypothetical protein C5167_026550 [Papaver somniferum]
MDIFSYSSLQKTSNIRNAEVQYMLHQLYQRSLSSSSTEIFHEVDLKPVFFEFGFIIIMKIVSGKRSYNGSKKWSFDRLISESFLPEKLINTVDHFPVLRWIGYQSTERKLKQGRKNKDSFLDELIQDYLLDTSSSADIDVVDGRKAEHKPLIGVFMSLQQDEPETYTDEVVKGIIGSINEVCDMKLKRNMGTRRMWMNKNLPKMTKARTSNTTLSVVFIRKTMFSGGIGTSVDTMVAAMSLLLKHPEALVKLRDEIEFHVEEGRFISESDLPKLPYLQCVIQESLRLHPPVTIPLPHLLSQDCTVAGYDIPLGTWGCPASRMSFRAISLAIGGLVQCLEWKRVDHDDEVIDEGDEPSPRAVCRPRLVKKDILSQI